MTEAFYLAADPTAYPNQLASGLTTWQTQKLYRVVELNNTDTITLFVPGDDYSDRLGDTYGEYSERVIRQSHQTQAGVLKNHLPRHWTNLSRIYPTPSSSEDSILDGLTYDLVRPACIRDWLICGSFASAGTDPLDVDFLVWNSGEEGTIPVAGMDTAGRIWTELNSDRDYVDFRGIYAPDNYDAVAYAYATIHSYATTENAKLRVCSHDGVKVWLNGVLVHENRTAREYDYEDIIDVTLEDGDNHLLIKVKAGGQFPDPDDGLIVKPWGFFAR